MLIGVDNALFPFQGSYATIHLVLNCKKKAMSEKVLGYDKKTVKIVVALVVVALVAFYAGAKYEKSKLTRLGLLGNPDTTAGTTMKKSKKVVPPVVIAQKFADQDYAKTAYLVSGPTLTADAQKALAGFQMSKKTLADGSTEITLKSLKPEYHDQIYTIKTGEQLYFIEKFLQDDQNGDEKNILDDTAVVVGADGMVVEAPRDFSK